jgi:hypothetical protein
MSLRELRNMIEHSLEWLFRTIFFWIRDDNTIGLWISYVHMAIVALIGMFVLTYRIFRPPFWMIVAVLAFMILLFLQHTVLRTCVLSRLEKRLMGEGGWFINTALGWCGISATREAVMGATICASGFCMLILVSEVMGELLNAI